MADKVHIGAEVIDKTHEFNIWYCRKKFPRYQQVKHVSSFLRSHQINPDDIIFELPAGADWFEKRDYVPIPEEIQEEIRTDLEAYLKKI